MPDAARAACLDLIYDRRREGYDPLAELLALYEGAAAPATSADALADLPLRDRLRRRIVDGLRPGLEGDLDEAMAQGQAPLGIVNDVLLDGMREVGDLFASGEMQLPFVLQSAETMKAAVSHLEPHMEKTDDVGRGRVVLATVKGDVHDIGKNLVDIILTNNGYEVVNLGIKVGINEMLTAVEDHRADALGMSGLLVKSTLIMRENLELMNEREMSHVDVLLGGAALTRTYVERDLRQVYHGRLFYGRDAFEGLRVLERLGELRRGEDVDAEFGRDHLGAQRPAPVPRRRQARGAAHAQPRGRGRQPALRPAVRRQPGRARDRRRRDRRVPQPHRALPQPVGLPARGGRGRPRVQGARRRGPARAAGAGPRRRTSSSPRSSGATSRRRPTATTSSSTPTSRARAVAARFTFPRQAAPPHLCVADFFRPVASPDADYASFMLVTMGPRVSERCRALFEENRYGEYLLLHGLGVEMAEALAELWHRRIREELGFADQDGPTLTGLFRQQYRGGRYSWGYPACPDLTDNATVAELLGAGRIGVSVSEGFQLHPEQTTDAIVCHHPRAKYFVA